MILSAHGRPVGIGSSAAILGHPARSLVMAAAAVSAAGFALEPGWIVMAGAATAAHPLSAGVHMMAEVEALGRVEFSVAN